MSKYVDANDKILYTRVHFQIIATVCPLKEQKLKYSKFIVQLQFLLV